MTPRQSWWDVFRQAPELTIILNRTAAGLSALIDSYLAEEAERAAAHFEGREALDG